MTYKQLSTVKTSSMEVNLIIDDVVNNARFCYHKNAFGLTEVSSYDIHSIVAACNRYGAIPPFAVCSICRRSEVDGRHNHACE